MSLFTPFMVSKKNNLLKVTAMLLAAVCLVGVLSQTALAENTYVINDGDSVTVHTTFASDPAKVLQEAGVTLAAEDMYTTESVDGVSEITVQRAQTITVHYGDEVIEANSYGETLQALFDRLGIYVDSNVKTSMPLDTVTYNGLVVKVDRVSKTTESYTVEIPFEVTYCEDPTLAAGEEKILSAGKPGQMLCTANVVYTNALETSRTVFKQEVLEEPVKQIIAVGTGEKVGQESGELIIGDGFIVLPTGEVLTYTHTDTFVVTAYTHFDEGCDTITANGAEVKWGVVAVDPTVVPYGTRMFIVAKDGSFVYGLGTAEDCGGAIQNKRLDLYMPTLREAFQFGIRDCIVYFLGDADWRE